MIRISPRRHGAALFWTITIACFLAASAGIAARIAYRAADAWNASLRGAMTVRIVGPDEPGAVTKAADLLHTAVGIYSAKPVTPERAAELLNGWAGQNVAAGDLPSLRLIELDVDRSQATPAFAKRLRDQLALAGYEAEVYLPGARVELWARAVNAARAVGVSLALALGLAALLTAGLAGRARASADRALIAPLADMGATRGQVAAIFASRSAIEGFLAGLLGAAAALAGIAYLLYSLPSLLPGLPLTDWTNGFASQDATIIAAATPFLAALLAAAGARSSANRAYGRASRLA
jgi:cell division protein FtsX